MSRTARRWLALAACCSVLALGLPWDDVFAGAQHPARVTVVGAVVLALVGLRTRSRVALRSAVAVGGAGVLLGDLTVTGGRLALAVAVLGLVLGLRAAGLLRTPGARPALQDPEPALREPPEARASPARPRPRPTAARPS